MQLYSWVKTRNSFFMQRGMHRLIYMQISIPGELNLQTCTFVFYAKRNPICLRKCKFKKWVKRGRFGMRFILNEKIKSLNALQGQFLIRVRSYSLNESWIDTQANGFVCFSLVLQAILWVALNINLFIKTKL